MQQRVHMPSLRHLDVRDFAPKVWGAACELLWGRGAHRAALHVGQRLHRQPRPRGRSRLGAAVGIEPWLAQGRRLLPPLPRLARAGPADDRAVVGHRAPRRRHLRRGRLRGPGGAAARRAPRGHPARRLRLRRPRRAVHEVHGDHGPAGRRRPHAPLRPARGVAEPSRHGAVHHEPADHPARAHALRPGGPRRALAGGARRAPRPGRRAARLGRRPRARASSPSGCCDSSA